MINLFKKIKQLILRIFTKENTVNYLSGSEALPQPLDDAHEKEVLQKLSSGDTSVKKELIEHLLKNFLT